MKILIILGPQKLQLNNPYKNIQFNACVYIHDMEGFFKMFVFMLFMCQFAIWHYMLF